MSADVEFIIDAAPRLATIATLATMSFALADGANEAMKRSAGDERYPDPWVQAAIGYQDGTLMMAVIRVCALLDSDDKMVSFQGVYKRLQREGVRRHLIEKVYGEEESLEAILGSPPELKVDQFLSTYREIDWSIHSRLIHFRNFGVAHLLDRKNWKSITYDEMRELVSLVGRLGDKLTELCRCAHPAIEPLLEVWREYGTQALASRGNRS